MYRAMYISYPQVTMVGTSLFTEFPHSYSQEAVAISAMSEAMSMSDMNILTTITLWPPMHIDRK